VLICDALRWDLAREVAGAVSGEIRPVLATLPTTTPFGMSALLPLDPADMVVALEDGVTLRTQEGLNLATREGRKRYLSLRLEGARRGKGQVGFVDMEEVLRGGRLPSSQLVVVFDDTIDAQGHKGTDDLPALANAIVGKVRRTIERLHEAGIPEVHLVTDHGFLLLPPDMVDGLGRPNVEVRQVLRRESRWCALKPGAPVGGLTRLPLPVGDGSIVLGFPRGVRTLVSADEFLHGGISLQEVVIPHVTSRVTVEPSPLEVEVSVAVSELVTGTIPVVIRSTPAGLFAQRPVTVRLWVESAADPGGSSVTEPVEIEVRADAHELKPPLYLREGAGLPAGSELVLRAVDVETRRELGGARMVLAVDWD
ncbi:MAG: PglZ domain-containing protein, partial [bacterium]